MRVIALLVASIGLVALNGCGEQAAAPVRDTRPPAKVSLPPVPPPEAFELVEKAPSGNWTVGGLQKNRAALFDKQVAVEGRVSEAYRCGAADGCLPPHFTVADLNRPDVTLLITGFDRSAEQGLKEGSVVTVTGTLFKSVEGFTLSEEGVIGEAKFSEAAK